MAIGQARQGTAAEHEPRIVRKRITVTDPDTGDPREVVADVKVYPYLPRVVIDAPAPSRDLVQYPALVRGYPHG